MSIDKMDLMMLENGGLCQEVFFNASLSGKPFPWKGKNKLTKNGAVY